MATYGNTTRYGFRKLLGGNLVSDIDLGFASLADDIDAKIATADKGSLSSLPTSNATTPGINGRLYFATNTVQLFYDSGTNQNEVATVEPWQLISFYINGWTADATTPVRYRRIGRVVHFMGQANNSGGSGGAAFTLPSAYWPSKALILPGAQTTNPPTYQAISVNTGGLVGPFAVSTGMRLDGISYPID